MSSAADPYLEWNAAYVLGSLSPSERREYEQHLSGCRACARAVASMAGMAGVLSTVPAESAMALLADDAGSGAKGTPASTLPTLLRAAKQERRRAHAGVAVLVAVVAAAVAVMGVELLRPNEHDTPAGRPDRLAMEQTVPSPITADAALITEAWGTRIEGTCRYAQPSAGTGQTLPYGLYVTTEDGVSVEVASWTATPGSEMTFTATTRIPVQSISSIDIRLLDKGIVLLKIVLNRVAVPSLTRRRQPATPILVA